MRRSAARDVKPPHHAQRRQRTPKFPLILYTPFCLYTFNPSTLERTSLTNPASFNEPRLISTLARAPLMAASTRAAATVKSEAMLGFVMGLRDAISRPTSCAFCAVAKGTSVASFVAE